MHRSRARHTKELSPSPSPNDKSHIERTLSYARVSYVYVHIRAYFQGIKIHSDLAPGAYFNLYRRELKDYVINGLNYGVGYNRFDISIRCRCW